jgi:hypothetical protein
VSRKWTGDRKLAASILNIGMDMRHGLLGLPMRPAPCRRLQEPQFSIGDLREGERQARKMRWCIPFLANNIAAVSREPKIAAGATSTDLGQRRLLGTTPNRELVLCHMLGKAGLYEVRGKASVAGQDDSRAWTTGSATAIRWPLLLFVKIGEA